MQPIHSTCPTCPQAQSCAALCSTAQCEPEGLVCLILTECVGTMVPLLVVPSLPTSPSVSHPGVDLSALSRFPLDFFASLLIARSIFAFVPIAD
jgi:hypothetical protein